MDTIKHEKSKYREQVEQLGALATSLRTASDQPVDASLFDLFETRNKGITAADLLDDLGINPEVDTINNLVTLPELNVRWIIPEIFRDAIRLGLRKAPIWPNITSSEQAMPQLKMTMPFLNMSDADLRYINEGETIPFGNISYGSKDIKVRKMGRGFKITDEVRQFSTLNILNIFLTDFGVKLGYSMDSLAIDCLLNGEQTDGSASAPVVGVDTTSSLVYKDLTKVWVRLGRMGKTATTMVSGEDIAITILNLPEYKNRFIGTPYANLSLKTPLPNTAELYVHGSIPTNQVVILDPKTTMIKFNAVPLKVESERIVSNQTEATYCSLTTGFANLFRDSRLIIDDSLAFSSNGFPAYMNVDALEVVTVKE